MCLLSTSGHDNKVALEIMIAEYESKYGKRIENAWILMEHWVTFSNMMIFIVFGFIFIGMFRYLGT